MRRFGLLRTYRLRRGIARVVCWLPRTYRLRRGKARVVRGLLRTYRLRRGIARAVRGLLRTYRLRRSIARVVCWLPRTYRLRRGAARAVYLRFLCGFFGFRRLRAVLFPFFDRFHQQKDSDCQHDQSAGADEQQNLMPMPDAEREAVPCIRFLRRDGFAIRLYGKASAGTQPLDLPAVFAGFNAVQPEAALFVQRNAEQVFARFAVNLRGLFAVLLAELETHRLRGADLDHVDGVGNGVRHLVRVFDVGEHAAGVGCDAVKERVVAGIAVAGKERIDADLAVLGVPEHASVGVFRVDAHVRIIQRLHDAVVRIAGIRLRIERLRIAHQDNDARRVRTPVETERRHNAGVYRFIAVSAVSEIQRINRVIDYVVVIAEGKLHLCRIIIGIVGALVKVAVVHESDAVVRALLTELCENGAHVFLGVVDIVAHGSGRVNDEAEVKRVAAAVRDNMMYVLLPRRERALHRGVHVKQTAVSAGIVIPPVGGGL